METIGMFIIIGLAFYLSVSSDDRITRILALVVCMLAVTRVLFGFMGH